MLQPDEVGALVVEMIQGGVDGRDEMVDALIRHVDLPINTLRRIVAKKWLSLALVTIRDDDGERLAFPARDDDGRPIVVHLDYSQNAGVMLELAHRKREHARREVREADRLEERAFQLDLFDNGSDPIIGEHVGIENVPAEVATEPAA